MIESLRVQSQRLAAFAVIPAQHPVRDKLQPESRETDWIPPYQVRGRLSQARNDSQ